MRGITNLNRENTLLFKNRVESQYVLSSVVNLTIKDPKLILNNLPNSVTYIHYIFIANQFKNLVLPFKAQRLSPYPMHKKFMINSKRNNDIFS